MCKDLIRTNELSQASWIASSLEDFVITASSGIETGSMSRGRRVIVRPRHGGRQRRRAVINM